MRLFITMLISIVHLQLLAQGGASSVFITLPLIAQQIKETSSEDELHQVYRKFEKDYPLDKFAQVYVLLDQVNSAAAEQLISWQKPDALDYILKIRQVNERNRLLQLLPAPIWHDPMVDSLITAFQKYVDEKQVVDDNKRFLYTELLSYSGQDQQALDYMVQQNDVARLQSIHPYLFIRLYRRTQQPDLTLPILSEIIRKGAGKPESKQMLQELWLESKRDQGDFAQYYESQLQVLRDSMQIGLNERLVSYEAPDFQLRNLEGDMVSLKDLRGKVVFLDFWATWCGPCLASFPAMQQVVNTYKNREDVVFLFVNTLEREEDQQEQIAKIKELFAQKSWDLPVVLDSKVAGQYDTVRKYKVSGIPAQFLIDKNGQVRYVKKGFSGGDESLIQEINLLIQHVLKF